MKIQFTRNGTDQRWFHAASGCVTLLLLAILFTGCEKTTLTEEEKGLVNKFVVSHIKAIEFSDAYVKHWNETLRFQMDEETNRAIDKFKKNYEIASMWGLAQFDDAMSRLSGSDNAWDSNVKKITQVSENYRHRFEQINSTMYESIKKDYRIAEKSLEAVYQYYHATPEQEEELNKKYQDLKLWEKEPYDAWLTIENHSEYAPDVKGVDEIFSTYIDISSVARKDIEAKPKEGGSLTYDYFFFMLAYKTYHDLEDIQIDYIVKEPETENSFQIGFTNHVAYLCSFQDQGESTRILYKPAEYDQTFVGKGI